MIIIHKLIIKVNKETLLEKNNKVSININMKNSKGNSKEKYRLNFSNNFFTQNLMKFGL